MRTAFIAGLCAAALSAAAQAQSPLSVEPGAVQRRSQETLDFYRLERQLQQPEERGPVIDKPAGPGEQKPAEPEQQVEVSRIETDPSEVLTQEEIRAITSAVEGKRVAIAELFDVVNRLNNLYASKGCVTCRAFLPPQDVKEGVVKIRLVEGRLGSVVIEDNQHTRAEFIRDRIHLQGGELFSLKQLEDDLVRLNGTNELKARAQLKPGEAFGTVDTVIRVSEPPLWQAILFADNAGRDTIGEYRVGLIVINSSLTGNSDPLTVTLYGAEGTDAVSASYSVPVSTYGTRLTAFYDWSQIQVENGPFAPLDISGHAWTAGASLSHPFIVTPESRLSGFVGYNAKRSTTQFGPATITDIDVRSVPYGIEFQRVDDSGVLFTRQFLTTGFDEWGGDRSFFKYNGDLTRSWLFNRGYVALLRGGWQWADVDLLPPSEQFQVGGTATVRGYTEGLLIGDTGWFLSAEYQVPIDPPAGAGPGPGSYQVRGFAFVDAGAAYPFRPGGGTNGQDYLYSVGVGALINLPLRLVARVALGVPLTHPAGDDQSAKIHFYVQTSF